jgi:hypothetical protein
MWIEGVMRFNGMHSVVRKEMQEIWLWYVTRMLWVYGNVMRSMPLRSLPLKKKVETRRNVYGRKH